MGITQKEADALNSEFMEAMPMGNDYSKEAFSVHGKAACRR